MIKKRILHLQTGSGISGGISVYISSLIKSRLYKNYNNIVAVSCGKDKEKIFEMYGNAEIVSLPKSYDIIGFFNYMRLLTKIIKTFHVDVVHSHALRASFPAMIVCKMIGIPLVYTNHGLRYRQISIGYKKVFLFFVEKILIIFSCAVVSIRDHDFKRINSKKSALIRTRIDKDENMVEYDEDFEKSLKLENDCKLILGVGSLITIKQPEIFVEWVDAIMKNNVRVRAIWAGDGPLKNKMKNVVDDRSLPIDFIGHVNMKDLSFLYRKADLLLLTSKTEIFPLSVIEAYSNGVPIISTDFDGVNDIVDEGYTGFIMKKCELDAIGLKVANILNDDFLLNKLKKNAFSRFVKYNRDVTIMAKEYSLLYENFFSNKDNFFE